MPNYLYKARDESGKLIRGTMDASSKDELASKIRNMGYVPTYVGESKGGFDISAFKGRFSKIGADDIIIFNLQLANMVSSGLTLLASLSSLAGVTENRSLRETIKDVARSVESGSSFSEALAKHPRVFSGLFVSMVRAGEASGHLDTILARWAAFSEKEEAVKQNVANALFYPFILFTAGVLVIVFIVTIVIPQFAGIFQEANLKLPLPTLILKAIGAAIKGYWYIVIACGALIFYGARYYIGTGARRLKFDKLCLSIPVMGPLARKITVSRFSRTLGTLIGSGVPILQSLDISGQTMDNEVLRRVIAHARAGVENGEKISAALKVSEEFPLDAIQMISAGEETGNLDGMLNKISDLYDAAISHTTRRLTAIIEPVLLVIMGLIVAFIMASMLIPIFDMIKMLRH